MTGDKTQKTWKDWLLVVMIAAVIVAAFVAPAYVVREQRQETERVLAQIEVQSAQRLEQMIQVNTYTISCLLAIPPEERSDTVFSDCIEQGFEQAPDVDQP